VPAGIATAALELPPFALVTSPTLTGKPPASPEIVAFGRPSEFALPKRFDCEIETVGFCAPSEYTNAPAPPLNVTKLDVAVRFPAPATSSPLAKLPLISQNDTDDAVELSV